MTKRYIVNTIDHSWRGPVASSDQPGPSEVVYEGSIVDPMIWDRGLQNIRPMTQQEIDAINAAAAAEQADKEANYLEKADLRDLASTAITRLEQIKTAQNPTTVQVIGAVQDMANILQYVIKALRLFA